MIGATNIGPAHFERSRETAATTPATDTREAALRQAAEAFEAVFLRQLIGSMRQAKLADDVFGSAASEQFRDIADSNLADNMAQQGSFGIADLLLQQMRAVIRRVDGPAEANAATDAPASHDTNNVGGSA